MAPRLDRRSFLQIVVVSATAGGTGLLSACADDAPPSPKAGPATFPLSVASGDPTPSTVILWTRVDGDGAESVDVTYEVSLDDAFTDIVAQDTTTVDESSDFTLRVKVIKLTAYTTYYYRFVAGETVSNTGRTKTAPETDADVAVRLAFAACQDYNGRYYHAWRALVEEEEPVDFVLHLGDYIYETEGDPRFQDPTLERRVQLPDGMTVGKEHEPFKAALTLADYRTIYKTYRSDPDVQRAHELYPFITIWDDHEFADDSWQDHSTHFDEAEGDEKNTDRRMAASRAWFEYQPADIVYDENASYPDDIKIYRKLRFGKHVELVLTDQRYYRDDHLIAEGDVDVEVAKVGLNTAIGSRQLVLKKGFDVKEAAAKPSMLGAEQKTWLIDAISKSDATWKLWGNQTQLAQMMLDLSEHEQLPENLRGLFYFTTDQWDGYRSERAEILTALDSTTNVIALTGDIHAFYASDVHIDFDAAAAAPANAPLTPTMVEYTVAGISSESVQDITQRIVDGSETLSSLGLSPLIAKFNEVLTTASPHYRYANSKANGIAIMDVNKDVDVKVSFVRIADVKSPEYAGVADRVNFRTVAGSNMIEKL